MFQSCVWIVHTSDREGEFNSRPCACFCDSHLNPHHILDICSYISPSCGSFGRKPSSPHAQFPARNRRRTSHIYFSWIRSVPVPTRFFPHAFGPSARMKRGSFGCAPSRRAPKNFAAARLRSNARSMFWETRKLTMKNFNFMPAFKRKLAGAGDCVKLRGLSVGASTLSSWIALVSIGISSRKYPASDRSKSCTSSTYLHVTFLEEQRQQGVTSIIQLASVIQSCDPAHQDKTRVYLAHTRLAMCVCNSPLAGCVSVWKRPL